MESQARLQRCTALKTEIGDLREQTKVTEDVIAGRRGKDQLNALIADVLFPPAMLLIDQHKAQKNALDEMQKKIDVALAEQHALQCT